MTVDTKANGRHKVATEQVIEHDGVRTVLKLWTPEEAARVLAELNTENRNKKPLAAARYASDMNAGRFFYTHQGIAFRENGTLADGQNRLRAIADSGKPQWILTTYGLSNEAVAAIDRGVIRTIPDVLKLLGFEFNDGRTVAVARRMQWGIEIGGARGAVQSDAELMDFILKHQEAIAFAGDVLGSKFQNSSTMAAVARASYHIAEDVLRDFGQIVSTGEGGDAPGKKAARRLREHMLAMRKKGTAGNRFAAILYSKATNAIANFAEGKDITYLQETSKDLFPLKDDAGRAEA